MNETREEYETDFVNLLARAVRTNSPEEVVSVLREIVEALREGDEALYERKEEFRERIKALCGS